MTPPEGGIWVETFSVVEDVVDARLVVPGPIVLEASKLSQSENISKRSSQNVVYTTLLSLSYFYRHTV